MKTSQSYGPFKWLWGWVKDQIVQLVPKDIAVCEFDCQKEQCTWAEWKTCGRRLSKAMSASAPLFARLNGYSNRKLPLAIANEGLLV